MEKKKVADLYQAVDDEGQKIMVETSSRRCKNCRWSTS